MADTSLPNMTEDLTPGVDSLLYTVDDPAGTPVDRKATVDNVLAANDARTKTLTNTTIDANGTGNSITNIDLAADVTGNLPVGNLNSGTAASASTFWRGDGTWAAPAGGGDMTAATYDPNSVAGDAFDQDNMNDGTTNKNYTAAEKNKLAGIETAADVTDAANVDAAGAVMNSDTSTASMSFVVDEDDMSSNSATKVPTQQSVKAYADTKQPLDSDLTTIAGLTATTDNFIQSKSSAWASRTPTQVTADLDAMVGDSGSGGTKGLVPAPASGDAAAGKYLKADGTWATPAGGGGGGAVAMYDIVVAPSGGDYTTIQAAVAAASAGAVIGVAPGGITESSSITSSLEGLSIVGMGDGADVSIGANIWTFSGSTTGVRIENLNITSTTGYITMTGTAKGNRIINNHFKPSGGDRIIYISSSSSEQNVIANNHFDFSGNTSTTNSYIQVAARSSVFGNNVVLTSPYPSSGVVYMTGGYSTVSGNSFRYYDTNGTGYFLKVEQYTTIVGNAFRGNSTTNHKALTTGDNANTIIGNTFRTFNYGIECGASSGYNTINGNAIYQVVNGVILNSADCVVSSNTFVGSGTSTGVTVVNNAGADYNYICNNKLISLTTGVSIAGSNCDKTVVANNYFRNCTTGISDSGTASVTTPNFTP